MPISAAASRASRRRSPCTWLPRPGGSPHATTSTTPPSVSPAFLVASISAIIAALVSGRGSAPRTRRRCPGRRASACTPAGVWHGADADHVAEHVDAEGLVQERLGHRAERHPGGGLARAGAFEDRTGVVEVVLLHADQIGVAGAGPGQRGVAGLLGEHVGIDRVGRHHRRPLRPLGVADPDRDRAAHGQPVPHAAGELDLVLLELHPGTAAVAEAAAARSRATTAVVTSMPAGSPSTTATSAGPCDSPAVIHRNTPTILPDF